MAGDSPIDTYLNDLFSRVASWHRKPDDVVAEAADHLRERTAQLERGGLAADQAAVRAIGEYGSPEQVADAHLRASRRPAIPTVDTRTAGIVAMLGGAGWVLLPVLTAVMPDVLPVWILLATTIHMSVASAVMASVGLWQRHGGLGPLATAATVPAVVALPFVLFAWPVPGWLVLLGAASLLFGVALLVRRLVPLPSSLAYTFGLAIAAGSVIGAEVTATRTGEDFAFLESTWATAGVISGMMLFGLGLLGLGRWLRSEQPVEIPNLPAPSGRQQLAT